MKKNCPKSCEKHDDGSSDEPKATPASASQKKTKKKKKKKKAKNGESGRTASASFVAKAEL